MLDSLFSPITINKRQLKNRCIVPAMVMNLCEEDGSCTERFAAYHEAKAKGGFAMIITEDFAITNVAGKGHQYIGGLWKDEHIPGFKEYTDRLHKWGALSIVQLHHPGRQIGVIDKDTPWAPSAIPCPFSPDMMPHEMTVAEIKLVVKQFGQAAARAKAAGFDGCELHGAHGYLIEEFMSPYSNKRTDEYGGDLCNRMRFALEIIHEVREQTGPDFIIGYKLSSDEWVSGGLTIEDTKAYVPFLEEAGVDYFGVSVGVYRSGDQIIPSMYTDHGWIANNAKEVKSVASVPVYAIGRINDTRVANAIIKSGKADMVAMGRQSIADPETPNKAKAGCFTDIRTCVGCLHGCDANVNLEKSGTCELNPIIGHESEAEYQTVMTDSPKNVLVIGAGPAGLEAAIGAAKRGHHVTVYDKDRWAGGKYRLASVPPCKGELGAFIVWQMHELKKLNVPVILNTPVTKELVDSVKPDVVIAATGTTPVVPKKIPGYDKDIVVLGTDVLSGKANTGHNVVVIGGGHAGFFNSLHHGAVLKRALRLLPCLFAECAVGYNFIEVPAERSVPLLAADYRGGCDYSRTAAEFQRIFSNSLCHRFTPLS